MKIIKEQRIIGDNIYKIDIEENGKYYDLQIWACKSYGDDITILSEYYNNIDEVYKSINETIDLYEKGFVRCVKCHKVYKREDIRHNRFYAGIYCDDCWNEPRFIERRRNETYD